MSLDPIATVSPLVRAALFVESLPRSEAFYGALGLTEVYFQGEISDTSARSLLQISPSAAVRVCILKAPASENQGMIGLFEITRPGLPRSPRGLTEPHLGEAGLVFYVPDLPAKLAALVAAGGDQVRGPYEFHLHNIRQREACLRDPDGVLVNLIEADPARSRRTAPDVEPGAS